MKIYLFLLPVLFITELMAVEKWTSFRGPTGMGVTEQKIPTSWNSSSILWKKHIPGEGQSSVVEAGNKLFITSSENSEISDPCYALVRMKVICSGKKTFTKAKKAVIE